MASWSTQLFWLSRREFRSVIRNKGALIAQFCAVTFMYCIIGNIFWKAAEYEDVDGSMESVVFVTTRHFGLITFIAIGSMFGLAQENMLNFPVERPIFLREYAGGTYNAAPYFFSKLMIETPRAFIVVTLIYLITYWMVGFNGSFVVMAGITTLFGLVAASVTLIIGAMVTNVEVGIQLTPLVFVPQLLFAGFYIPIDDIPVYMRWAQYLCSLKYAVNLLLIEEMKDLPSSWPSDYNTSLYTRAVFGCNEIDSDYNCIGDRDIVGIPGTSDTTDFGLFPRTDVFYDQRFTYVGILLGIFVAFRLGSLAILVHKAKNF